MTTRAAAEKAALTYRETQPAIDALKTTLARNAAAKKTLGAYMVEKKLRTFRGVGLKCVPFDGWDNDKLRSYLGEKARDFRKTLDRKYFYLVKRPAARKSKAQRANAD